MHRVSQKLLTAMVFVIALTSVPLAGTWKVVASITKGADGVPMRYPLGVFYDSVKKRLYIVDSGNNRLLSFNLKWEPLKVFDAKGTLRSPMYMARDDKGNLYVVERKSNVLKKINLVARSIKEYTLVRDGYPVLIDRIAWKGGNLYVLDRVSGDVLVYDRDLRFVKSIVPDDNRFKGFFDFKIKGDFLWGMEVMSGRVFAIPLKEGKGKVITPDKRFVEPVSFEIDNLGNIYILDRYLKEIFVFSPEGSYRYSFSKEGFREGSLYYPWLLLFVGNKLLVLDEGNGRVDVWSR